MANFKTHMVVGASASGVSSTLLLSGGIVSGSEAFLLFTLGSLSSLLPDLDSKTSVPFKITSSLLSVFLAFFVIFSKPNYSLLEMGILWFATFYGIRHFATPLFLKMTSHRGIFHSIPMALLFGLVGSITMKSFFWTGNSIALWSGFFITFGYLVHLTLDEIYSVDLTNHRLKKSFGTALSIWKKDNVLGMIGLYGAVIFLSATINFDPIFQTLGNEHLYMELSEKLFPKGTWFENLFHF
jgi:membrane-bound metal-dependent hydrolase YbcI (DUF457 family)